MNLLLALISLSAAEPLRDAVVAAQLPWPPPKVWLHIDKSERTLTLWSGEVALRRYRVGLGASPVGDKERQGDMRTPTGDLRVVTRNAASSFHRFLGLSYPEIEDADRAEREGWLSAAAAQRIREQRRAGKQPDWNTALGGEVGIHGGGSGADWTWGCIAVEDAEIAELWEVTRIGTLVRIEE